MVSDSLYPLAVELLIRPESSLISESEPVNRLIEVICAGSRAAEQISRTLFTGNEGQRFRKLPLCGDADPVRAKVLRLLAKGWGINQIAALLKRAIRRSARRKIAQCVVYRYAATLKCMPGSTVRRECKELNINSAYGEQMEWKKIAQPSCRHRRKMCDDGNGTGAISLAVKITANTAFIFKISICSGRWKRRSHGQQ